MKNFILTLSVFLMTNIAVNGQEIIETKPIEQIQITSIPFEFPDYGNQNSIVDSSKLIRMYCGVTKLDSTRTPLLLIKKGEFYYKLNFEEFSKSFNPRFIQSIDVIKKEDDLKKFGSFAKNGVMIINIEKDKANEFLDFSKAMKYELIK